MYEMKRNYVNSTISREDQLLSNIMNESNNLRVYLNRVNINNDINNQFVNYILSRQSKKFQKLTDKFFINNLNKLLVLR